MAITDLSKVLSDHSVEHEALHDHMTNGRPYSFAGDGGIMIHHTASENSALKTIRYGYSGLPGPLSQFFVEMIPEPKIYVVSSGYCNHAGKGSSRVYDRCLADEPVGEPGPDDMTGNRHFYGVEIEGNSADDFLDERYQLTVDLTVAMCKHFKWDPLTRVVSHKEWTKRKVDPYFDMDKFRTDVKQAMVTPKPIPDAEWPVWAEDGRQLLLEAGAISKKARPLGQVNLQRFAYMIDKLVKGGKI